MPRGSREKQIPLARRSGGNIHTWKWETGCIWAGGDREKGFSVEKTLDTRVLWKWKSLSCVWLWEWPCEPMDYNPWVSPDQKTGVHSLSLLQGIFPTQGSNPGLPHCGWILYQLCHQWSLILEWVVYPFSGGSSQPRNLTGVTCIAGGFFTNWSISVI